MDNEEGYDVTLELGVRGSWTVFVVERDELTATANAVMRAKEVLIPGFHVSGVKVAKRRRHES